MKIKKIVDSIWQEAYHQNDINILSLLETNNKAESIDIGCGDGVKTNKFRQKIGAKWIAGIDGVKGRLAAASKRRVKPIIYGDLEKKWRISNNQFDVVISNQVIEHVIDIDHFISEIKRVLKPNGYCVISTENLASWHNIIALILGYQDFSHHILRVSHVGNPLSPHYKEKTVAWSKEDNSGFDDTKFPHNKILTYKSLIKSFETYGFTFENGLGSGYYPFFGVIGKLLSRMDPTHSHFITVKMRKVSV